MASKIASRKARGRRLQQLVAAKLLELFSELNQDDVQSRGMGQSGTDVMLSQAAKKCIPFDIECKAHESLNIWKALEQAESNNDGGRVPLVVFKRNRSKVYACLELDHLLEIFNNAED